MAKSRSLADSRLKKGPTSQPSNIDGGTLPVSELCEKLSKRERQVLRLFRENHTDKQIARELKIEVQSVRNIISSIQHKLGTDSRVELAFLVGRCTKTTHLTTS